MALSAPEPISAQHLLEEFDSGKISLNNWLKTRALSNHKNGFTAVSVVHEDQRVLGYYGLSPTTVVPSSLPRNIRTGQPPNLIPCLLLGQLAVDKNSAGRGIGSGLLKHALISCAQAANLIGGRALIVNAIDDEAASFWQRRGFLPTKNDPLMLFRSMADVITSIQSTDNSS
jgi:GNAT superfamily N-acetyltransferase